jgi:hypothetical protein
MAWNAAQQAAIDRVSGGSGYMDGLTEEQRKAIKRAEAIAAAQPTTYSDDFGNIYTDGPAQAAEPESRGLGGTLKDFTTGVAAAVPRATAGVVSLGSLVPGVNKLADPLAEALMDAGDWVDEQFLSDYQKNINTDMAQAMADSAKQLGEDASITDHLDNITSQGGAAAKFIGQNPLQALMLAGQAIPYLVGGGALARTANATVKGVQTARGVTATGLTPAVAGATGEGLMAAGAVEAEIVGQLRDEGTTEYTAGRLAAIPAGVATSLIGLGGAKVSAKLGIGDVDTAVAGQSVDLVAEAPKKGLIKGALAGGASEGVEELFQSGSEQAFTNLGTGDPLSEDVGSSAVFGAAAGAPIGSVVGAFGNSGTDLDALAAAKKAEEESAALELEAQEANKVADLRAQQEQAALTGQKQARRQVAAEFPLADYEKAQKAQQALDIDDNTTELGQAFEAHLDTLPGTEGIDPAKIKKAKTKFLTRYQKGTAEALEQEYVAELDARVAALAQDPVDSRQGTFDLGDAPAPAAGQTGQLNLDLGDTPAAPSESSTPAPEKPAAELTKKEQGLARAKALLGEDWENDASLSQLADNTEAFKPTKTMSSRFDRRVDEIVSERSKADATAEMQKAETLETAEDAFSYATSALGEGWEDTNVKLANLLADGDLIKFRANVDSAVEKQEAADRISGDAASLAKPKNLTANEGKVWDLVSDYFTGNKKDELEEIFAGKVGEEAILYTNIAKLLDVQKTDVSGVMPRVRTKLLEKIGLLKPLANKATKDAAVALYRQQLKDANLASRKGGTDGDAETTNIENTVAAELREAGLDKTIDKDGNQVDVKPDEFRKLVEAEVKRVQAEQGQIDDDTRRNSFNEGVDDNDGADEVVDLELASTGFQTRQNKGMGLEASNKNVTELVLKEKLEERIAARIREKDETLSPEQLVKRVRSVVRSLWVSPTETTPGKFRRTKMVESILDDPSFKEAVEAATKKADVGVRTDRDEDTPEQVAAKAKEAQVKADADKLAADRATLRAREPLLRGSWSDMKGVNDAAFEFLTEASKIKWLYANYIHFNESAQGRAEADRNLRNTFSEIVRTPDYATKAPEASTTTPVKGDTNSFVAGKDVKEVVTETKPKRRNFKKPQGGANNGDQRRNAEVRKPIRKSDSSANSAEGSGGDAGPSGGKGTSDLRKQAEQEKETKPAPVVETKPKKKVVKKPAAATADAPAQSPSAQKEQKRRDGNAVNAQQFKDSYNSSSLDDLKSNPALAEVVEFADYLNSLTDAQWAKITPTFGNDKNPFKAPSMDVEQIRGFIDNTLNEPDAPNVSTRTQTKLMPKSFKTGTEFVADVYHGTDTDIQDDFDASKLGENTGAGSAKEAFFFAGKGETANGYAMVQSEKQKEGRLNKLRLVAKKFLKGDTLNAQDQQQLDLMLEKSKYVKDGAAFVEDLVAQAKKNPGLATKLARTFASELRPGPRPNVQMQRIRMKNPLVKDFKGARFRDETYVSLIKKAKENGHDGVVLLNTYDVAGKTKDQITEADMDNIFAVFDTDNITNTFKERKDSTKFSRPTPASNEKAATAESVKEVATAMFDERFVKTDTDQVVRISPGNPYSRLKIHATAKEAFRALKGSMTREELSNAQGFIDPRDGDTAHVIAENIKDGDVGGVILHEVGVHLGLEGMMDDAEVSVLADAVDQWATMPKDSNERKIYDLVTARIAAARMLGMDESHLNSEKIAYAVEEATRLGVRPNEDSMFKASVWLGNVQKFLTRIITQLIGTTPGVALSAEELVSVAYGAAKGVMREGVVEEGATTDSDDILMQYYAGNDRTGRQGELPDNAKIIPHPYKLMGGEVFEWGKGSKISDKKNISTEASFFQGGMNMAVYAAKDFDPFIEIRLDQIETGDAYIPHVYSLTVFGGMESTNSTDVKDVDGDTWSRMEGVPRRTLIRLLAEARRRLTRHHQGAIPNIIFDRVTGAAVANKTGARRGTADYETLYKKFSLKRENLTADMKRESKRGVSEAREWVGGTLGETSKKFFDDASYIAQAGAKSLKFLHQFVRDNRESMPAIGRWYDGMLKAEATRNEIRKMFEDIALRARDLAPDRMDAVNDFLGKSTFYQKWAYDPQIEGKAVTVDPVLKIAFDRFSSTEQQLIKDVFAHGEKMRQRKRDIAKKMGVSDKFFSDSALEGPYAPLKRFGNFAGELKSAELIAARTASEAEGATQADKDRYKELQSDPDHYVISFFDTMGAAKQFRDANKAKFPYASATEKAPNIESDRISNPEVYEKIMGALKASADADMDPAAKKAFRDMVQGMYIQSLDERSARLSGARRLNRAGYDKNMMRSFLYHARAESSLIAQLENGTEINTAFAEAGRETREGDGNNREEEKQAVYNMVARHYTDTLQQKETPIQDRIAAMNSVYMLTTSIGYHVTNATQPIMVTVPRIAGDFKNYTGAWSALFKGYGVSIAATRMTSAMETEIDIDKAPPRYRKLLEHLQQHQLLDLGMEEDLSTWERFNTGYEPLNRLSDTLGKITHKLYQVARYVEAHNRISAAVAAYDMADKNRSKVAAMKMTPLEYATAVVEDTQGNFSRLDAPLLLKALPKITVQYRKYQLLMAWHYTNAFNQGFRDESPEVRATGKRVLTYSIAHAALGAGATGVPLVSTAFWLTTFLGDEDEPDDLERWITRNVEDKDMAKMLSRGIPSFFGLDMSTKLSQSKIFLPFPYVDYQTGEDGAKDLFFNAFAGPAGTTAVNFYRAAEYAKEGDVLKSIEYAVPKGMRSVSETYRLATEGYTLRNGDIVVDPREISAGSLLLNAMGLPSSKINDIKWTRGQQYELDQYFSKQSGSLRKQYIKAHRSRDTAKMRELRGEWKDLQDAKDRVRPFYNNERGTLKRQNVLVLIKAPRKQSKREDKYRKQLTGN